MARRKQGNVVQALADAAALDAAIAQSDRYLTVIDVYQNWCGPAAVIEPVLRRIFMDVERADERLKVYTMDESLLSDEQKKHIHQPGCKPLFLVYKSKVQIAKISGVNAPELETTIMENVPSIDAE